MGVKLSLADIREDALVNAIPEITSKSSTGSRNIVTSTIDVRSSRQVNRWIEKTMSAFGVLNGATNFAGIVQQPQTITAMSDEDWHLVQDVNLNGTFYALRAQLRAMGEDGGSVVNTASVAGLRGGFGGADYSASKHGVIGNEDCCEEGRVFGHSGQCYCAVGISCFSKTGSVY
jgi:NAD(P)-dependent dehydrogenase (short-subunit alcohol dehydrogenase family)